MKLQFREITLADKPLFDKMFEVSFHKTRECSFAYVYLWRENFDPHVASGDGWLVVKLDMGDRYAFNPVCVPPQMLELMNSIEQYAHNNEQPVTLSFLNKSDCEEILPIKPDWVQSPQELRLRASKESLNPVEKVYKYVITEAGLEKRRR